MSKIDGQESEAGARAAMELHSAAITAGGAMRDGRMARRDVESVRANARWLVQMCEQVMGEPHPDDAAAIERKRAQASIEHLRRELRHLAQEVTAPGVAKSPAERLARQTIVSAKLGQTVRLAELLLDRKDFEALVDSLHLRSWMV